MRLALALLPVEPEKVRDELGEWMLQADDPGEVLVVREALRTQTSELTDRLWGKAEDARLGPAERFRALAALAAFDPQNQRWAKVAPGLTEELLTSNPLHLGAWVQALRPVRQRLLAPLSEVFRGTRLPETPARQVAAIVLADFAADRADLLGELLLDADAKQYAVMRPVLEKHREAALARMQQELARLPEVDPERLARRQATAAATLLHLGWAEPAWPLWRHGPVPTARSYLVQQCGLLGVDARLLMKRLLSEKDTSARRALIVALGDYTEKELPALERGPLVKTLLSWYRQDTDAGIHGAIDWLLRHGKEGPADRPLDWGQGKELDRIDAERTAAARALVRSRAAARVGLAAGSCLPAILAALAPGEAASASERSRPLWHVTGQGMTFTIVARPIEFEMGSPATELGRSDDEPQHRRQISRSFAIATKLVTVAQWQRFLKDRPEMPQNYGPQYSPEPECPINGVSWFMAAAYCNWLSEKEGAPKDQWCYPEKIEEGMKPYPDHLRRAGYRLLTEAEWEYACRAGSRTSRYYGSPPELLSRYAVHQANSQDRTWPVGQKRPNDLGLFDMHGNAWTWCQDENRRPPLGELVNDSESSEPITESKSRVLRGGGYDYLAPYLRSASRMANRPGVRSSGVGLRVARTLR